jgi:NitT/TauT family transport system ATP-binding protein
MVGLLEYLDARGGGEDLFRIAADTNQEFGTVISIVKVGEMLDFVDTPKRHVVLTKEGERFVKASSHDRKEMLRTQLLTLRLFQEVDTLIKGEGDSRRDDVLKIIHAAMPYENYERIFDKLVGWGRFADLFAYDEVSETLSPQ